MQNNWCKITFTDVLDSWIYLYSMNAQYDIYKALIVWEGDVSLPMLHIIAQPVTIVQIFVVTRCQPYSIGTYLLKKSEIGGV